MPIKITKKSKRTKKGKVSQSQQVIVNIQKGKRKVSSQPVIRQSQAPIIIQPPQQDFSQLENLFRQYSTSRSVAEPVKPVTIGMETQTEMPIIKSTGVGQTDLSIPHNLEQNIEREKELLKKNLKKLDEEKPIPVIRQRAQAPQRQREQSPQIPVRAISIEPDKVYNPESKRMINVGGNAYKKAVKSGIKLTPEKMN